MFVGHYSVGLAARRGSIQLPLWVWFVAVQWLDFVFMALVLLGVEKMRLTPGFTETNELDLYFMPYSHSLVGAVVISVVFAGLVALAFRAARSARGVALVTLVSFSHWILDALVHTPDLPILSGDPKVGFGLWNHLAVSLPLELAVLGLGAWIYAQGLDSAGRRRLAVLLALMVVLLAYSIFGPAPTSVAQFAGTALAAYILLTVVAAWADRAPTDTVVRRAR